MPFENSSGIANANESHNLARRWWIAAASVLYFLILSAVLLYKHHALLNDWPLDQAYMIQQFHNWNSGYPKVTIQPGDLRSGFPGEKPFEESHRKWIYFVFKPFYWIWPYPETLILLYAFFVSLSVVTLYLFLKRLSLSPMTIFGLVVCWMLYPLQQKIAAYTFCDPLSMSGTFYFFYLYLLCRNSPYAILGCLGLIVPREDTVFLVLPTFLLLPGKWKTLLWHLAVVSPFLIFAKSGDGNPFAYAAASFHPTFISNFVLTQTVLWALALINPLALLLGIGFVGIMIGLGGEIYFRFPGEFQGSAFTLPGGFYYYAPFMAMMMAAVALGIAKLKSNRVWRLRVTLALLLVPGIVYALFQFNYLGPQSEARLVQNFRTTYVSEKAVVVTDDVLSAAFANRDQIYVYLQPPKGVSFPRIFELADYAIIRKPDHNEVERVLSGRLNERYRRVMESENYLFYKTLPER